MDTDILILVKNLVAAVVRASGLRFIHIVVLHVFGIIALTSDIAIRARIAIIIDCCRVAILRYRLMFADEIGIAALLFDISMITI